MVFTLKVYTFFEKVVLLKTFFHHDGVKSSDREHASLNKGERMRERKRERKRNNACKNKHGKLKTKLYLTCSNSSWFAIALFWSYLIVVTKNYEKT